MPWSRKATVRFARAATIATTILAASGGFEVTGQPLFTALDKIAFNLAAAQSEARKLRAKAMPQIASQSLNQLY
jgi:hypothetical protein